MPDIAVVDSTSNTITVALDGRTFDLHAMWLRDACTCPECRVPATNERLLDSTSIDPGLLATGGAIEGDHLRVDLSDGHRSHIAARWLIDHLRASDRRAVPAAGRRIWNATTGATVPAFERTDLDQVTGLCAWLDVLLEHGVALVRGVRPDDAGVRDVAALIGEIRATNYGVTWTIDATIEPESAVDSERPLAVHTDLPYRDVAPGVQLLLAAVVDVDGGHSTVVDGYAVAEELRRRDPSAWSLLTRTEFSYPFVRDDAEFHGQAPLIGLHPNGAYFRTRRAPDLVGVPFTSAADTPSVYRAVAAWNDLLDSTDFEVRVPLQPGDLLAFDNHRVLHGRTGFDLGTAGRRRLHGCYLDIDDVRSRRAVAGRQLNAFAD